jgi:hypothetical protein
MIIGVGLVLMALIMGRAIRRLGRGLSESARAHSGLKASLDQYNRIAAEVSALHEQLGRLEELVAHINSALRRCISAITRVTGYLADVDGPRFTGWQDRGVSQAVPPNEEPPIGYAPAEPEARLQEYTGELPFNPNDWEQVLPYVMAEIPKGIDPRSPHGEGSSATWLDYAIVTVRRRYNVMLSPDVTSEIKRVKD